MTTKTTKLFTVDLDKLESIANAIAKKVKPKDIICLYGELGTGKTTFAQYIIRTLDKNLLQPVTSPTFNLVNVYDGNVGKIWHFDLYRLNKLVDVYELGYEEAISSGITIIEWPQIIESILPQEGIIKIYFEYSKLDSNKRDIKILVSQSLAFNHFSFNA